MFTNKCQITLFIQKEMMRDKDKIKVLEAEREENEFIIMQLRQQIGQRMVRDVDISDYRNWDHNDIFNWIMTITDDNGDYVFAVYEGKLKYELQRANVSGDDLSRMTKDDLMNFRIVVDKDRQLLFDKIQDLIDNDHNERDDQNEDGSQISHDHEIEDGNESLEEID